MLSITLHTKEQPLNGPRTLQSSGNLATMTSVAAEDPKPINAVHASMAQGPTPDPIQLEMARTVPKTTLRQDRVRRRLPRIDETGRSTSPALHGRQTTTTTMKNAILTFSRSFQVSLNSWSFS
jgi:hypothetical protein